MSDKPLYPLGSIPAEPLHALTDRVRARVAEAALVLDRRAHASRQRVRRSRPRPQLPAPPAATTPAQTPEAAREARSLRVVYHELGDAHRQYRLRTGHRVPPALRDAARAFKQAPSLGSLVLVAAFLDEAGILGW